MEEDSGYWRCLIGFSESMENEMRYALFLLVLAAVCALEYAFSSMSGGNHKIPLQREGAFLGMAIFYLLASLIPTYLMTRFPELGVQIAELDQF